MPGSRISSSWITASDSINKVDQIRGNLDEQYAKHRSTASVPGLGSAHGAYIGERIRSEPDSHRQRDTNHAPSTPVLERLAKSSYQGNFSASNCL
jgi:hypothetical protein